jgi:hypothetical protein
LLDGCLWSLADDCELLMNWGIEHFRNLRTGEMTNWGIEELRKWGNEELRNWGMEELRNWGTEGLRDWGTACARTLAKQPTLRINTMIQKKPYVTLFLISLCVYNRRTLNPRGRTRLRRPNISHTNTSESACFPRSRICGPREC